MLFHDLDATVTVADEFTARERLQGVVARIPGTVQAEARVSRGPVGETILDLVAELSADLVTLGSHGWSSEQHVSISEQIVARAPCPVLAFQEGRGEHSFRLRDAEKMPKAVVPSDFSKAAATAVDYAFELARTTPLELHLLSVCASDQEVDVTRQRLAQRVPDDLAGRVRCHARLGAVGEGIKTLADDLDAEIIVMGEHAPGFLRRYLTHDTSREMLHRALCPVWYVPQKAAA